MLKEINLTMHNSPKGFGNLIALQEIYQAFQLGGYIAGGFARHIAHMILLKEQRDIRHYLDSSCHQSTDPDGYRAGDIDIFFPPKANLDQICCDTQKSMGGFANNLFKGPVTIQYVTLPSLRYTTVGKCLNHFDLINSKYAIIMRGKSFYLVYDPNALKLDADNTIEINRTDGPFLASRILKYFKFRGCNRGLASGSRKKLTEWYIRTATSKWPDIFELKHLQGIKKHTRCMQNIGMLNPDELIFFLGKWTIMIPDNEDKYGPKKEVDWALHHIGEANSG